MIEKVVRAEKLTAESFKPFGSVLGPQRGKPTVTSEILDFWDLIAELRMENPEAGYLVVKPRPFTFSDMERHVKTPEGFVPLGGCSIFPLAPPGDLDDPKALPDVDEISAFIMDGTKAVILKKGVWHWAPFPLGEAVSFLVILRRGTVEDDLDIKDLSALKGVTIRLTL